MRAPGKKMLPPGERWAPLGGNIHRALDREGLILGRRQEPEAQSDEEVHGCRRFRLRALRFLLFKIQAAAGDGGRSKNGRKHHVPHPVESPFSSFTNFPFEIVRVSRVSHLRGYHPFPEWWFNRGMENSSTEQERTACDQTRTAVLNMVDQAWNVER